MTKAYAEVLEVYKPRHLVTSKYQQEFLQRDEQHLKD